MENPAAPVVVCDSRTPVEFERGCIPGAFSAPSFDLTLQLSRLTRQYDTVVVNCAGRTRSIIGTATLQVLRDGRSMNIPVKLAERPQRDRRGEDDQQPVPSSQRGPLLGMSVREIDNESAARFRLPDGTSGVIVSRVEPMSPAFDASIERGHVLLEINRQPVRSIDDYRRLTSAAFASSTALLTAIIPLALPLLGTGALPVAGVVAALAISATVVDVSPFSTNGALMVANRPDTISEERYYKQVLYYSLLVTLAGPLLVWAVLVVPGWI